MNLDMQEIQLLTCDQIQKLIIKSWDEFDLPDKLSLLEVIICEKECKSQSIYIFIVQMINESTPYYRKRGLELLRLFSDKENRQIFFDKVKTDPNESVKICALTELSEIYRSTVDKEILGLALSIFEDKKNSNALRLAAGAVMMYQWGISHDKDGRPAWWDDDEEVITHPLITKAVELTKELLNS